MPNYEVAFLGLDGSGKTGQCKDLVTEVGVKNSLKAFSLSNIKNKPRLSHSKGWEFISYLKDFAKELEKYDVLHIRTSINSIETDKLSQRVFHTPDIFTNPKHKPMILDLCQSTVEDHKLYKQHVLDKLDNSGKVIVYDRLPISDVFYKQLYNIEFDELKNIYSDVLIEPNVYLLLDVKPTTSKQRSGHDSVLFNNYEKLGELRGRFLNYFENSPNKHIIDSEQSYSKVRQEVNSRVFPLIMGFLTKQYDKPEKDQ